MTFRINLRIICQLILLATSLSVGHGAWAITVYTTNYPLAWFAEQIGGVHVDVHFPAPSDVDPVFWQPDAETISAYQKADLILLSGAGYYKWTESAFLPSSRLVDTSSGYADRLLSSHGAGTHSHGPEGDHSHSGTAWTTWLDFELAALQAGQVRDALTTLKPDAQDTFDSNYEKLQSTLKELDGEMLKLSLISLRSEGLLASHPIYQYPGYRYGLDIISVTWEPDVFPEEEQWSQLEKLSRKHGLSKMLWESPPLEDTASRLEEMGITVIVFNPAGNVPDSGDWLTVMQANITNLKNHSN